MLRVEFIGLPGVGKTTIRKELLKNLQRVDSDKYLTMEEAFFHVSRSEIDKFYRLILKGLPAFFAKKISLKMMNRSLMQYQAQNEFLAKWGRAFDIFLRSREFYFMAPSDREILISGFLQTGSCFTCINRNLFEKKVIFFEEGFVQKSFMFVPHGPGYDQGTSPLNGYLSNIPLPHMIIFIKADMNVCLDRMINRRKGLTSRLKNAKKSEIINFLSSSHKHLQEVVLWLQENSDTPVFEVSNNGAFEKVVSGLEKNMIDFFTEFNGKTGSYPERGTQVKKSGLQKKLRYSGN